MRRLGASLLLAAVGALLLVGLALAAEPAHDDSVTNLTEASFDAFVAKVPAGEYLMVEYFASWCPVCQRFKPEYARVAAALNNANHPPKVHTAAVDCVTQVKLCNRFNVQAYPSVRLGHPPQFAGNGTATTLVEPAQRTAASLMEALNAALHTSFLLDPPATGGGASKPLPASTPSPAAGGGAVVPAQVAPPLPQQFDLQDVVSSTVLAYEYSVASGLMKKENRKAFVDWTKMVAEAHPHAKCRQGATSILMKLESVWPPGEDAPVAQMARFRPCGKGVIAREWGACRGSNPKWRGYTCGLWSLFHAMSLRARSGDAWLAAVRSFVGAFFQCADCRKHFLKATSRPEMAHLPAPSDAALWLFRVHNEVNARLKREEGTQGDPMHPKIQWPPPSLCERCRCQGQCKNTFTPPQSTDVDGATVVWDADEVLAFLKRYYGGEGDRSAAARPELTAAERTLAHPPSTTTTTSSEAKGGKGRERASEPRGGGGKGDGQGQGQRGHGAGHHHHERRFGHGGRAGGPVVTVSPDDDAGAAARAAAAAEEPRVQRDPSGRRKEGKEGEWVHTVGDSLRPGADPLEQYSAQQRQQRLREERERRLGDGPTGGGSRGPAPVPRRRYHAPWGLHPAVFIAGCALGPVMLYAGFVYARAMLGVSGPAPRGGRRAGAAAAGKGGFWSL